MVLGDPVELQVGYLAQHFESVTVGDLGNDVAGAHRIIGFRPFGAQFFRRECSLGIENSHIATAVTRCLGLASRFVSGYLYEPANDGTDGTSNRAAGSMHAWAEVYLPGAGWRGFDPTNGILTDHHFVTSAVANRPEWVNPIQGKYFHDGEVGSNMRVVLRVEGSAS